jgi:hypothetical protein
MLTRPTILLRLEAALLFVLLVIAYAHWGRGWLLFAILFLAPDLFMLGYLRNARGNLSSARLGAAIYNLGHFTVVPLLIMAVGYWFSSSISISIGLIWLSHIELDRALAYGLKYPTAFKDTHLSRKVAAAN